MRQFVFETKMPREEALRRARNKGDWFWNIIFMNKPLADLQLTYVEYIIAEIKTTSAPSLVSHMMKKQHKPVVKKLSVIVNGTTGSVALAMDLPKIEVKDFTDEDKIQYSNFSDHEAMNNAKKLAHKLTHRTLGGLHEAEIVEYKSVFRPFWVAYYGELKEGNRVRYITIPADNGRNQRAR